MDFRHGTDRLITYAFEPDAVTTCCSKRGGDMNVVREHSRITSRDRSNVKRVPIFFPDTFAVRATDGCTMLCYVPYIHGYQFSLYLIPTLVIFSLQMIMISRLTNFFFSFLLSSVNFFFLKRKSIYETTNEFSVT